MKPVGVGVNECGHNPRLWPTIAQMSPRCARSALRWTQFVRRDVYRLGAPRNATDREQKGMRPCVVLQVRLHRRLHLIVAPTSKSAGSEEYRPVVVVDGQPTRVLVEQMTAIDLRRLGDQLGRLSADEASHVDEAVLLVLGLDSLNSATTPVARIAEHTPSPSQPEGRRARSCSANVVISFLKQVEILGARRETVRYEPPSEVIASRMPGPSSPVHTHRVALRCSVAATASARDSTPDGRQPALPSGTRSLGEERRSPSLVAPRVSVRVRLFARWATIPRGWRPGPRPRSCINGGRRSLLWRVGAPRGSRRGPSPASRSLSKWSSRTTVMSWRGLDRRAGTRRTRRSRRG